MIVPERRLPVGLSVTVSLQSNEVPGVGFTPDGQLTDVTLAVLPGTLILWRTTSSADLGSTVVDPQAERTLAIAVAAIDAGRSRRTLEIILPNLCTKSQSLRIRSTASSNRSSGVVSEMRKKPSPLGP